MDQVRETVQVDGGVVFGHDGSKCAQEALRWAGRLAGQVSSPVALRGSYELAVQSRSKGGSSNIKQGGEFSAPADRATTIGQVTLNADAQYEIDFSISHGGKTIDCSGKLITQL